MSDIDPFVARLQLRPFQQEAVDRFFARTAPERQILLAPIGAGKGTTASAVVAEAINRGAEGVAVLAASNVVAQGIAWRAATAEVTPFELHRALPPSMSASVAARWPARVITFGSLRQAGREPIASALRARPWDVLIVDLSAAREEDAESLREFLSNAQVGRVLALNDGEVVTPMWSWLDAAPLAFSSPEAESPITSPVKFSVVQYERTPADLDLAGRAHDLTRELRRLGLRIPARLSAAVNSSPLAAQSQAWAAAGSLRHLRNRLAHGLPGDSEPKTARAIGPEELPELERVYEALVQLGGDVDLLESDAKWSAFLSDFQRRGALGVVLFCDFAETAAYVANRLKEVGIESLQLADSPQLARSQVDSSIVLVTRDDLLLGIELRHARVAYNYDLPRSQRRAHIRWSRLDWSRTDPAVEMVTLLDRRNASPTEKMSFAQFQHLVSDD
ncbi:MAG: hypothetical protein ACJ762_11420 [Solirubrobacteraceae bacterium]